jgi:hypothetical protein
LDAREWRVNHVLQVSFEPTFEVSNVSDGPADRPAEDGMKGKRDPDRAANEFCLRYGLKREGLLPPFATALDCFVGPRDLLAAELGSRKPKRPTWGILWRMLDRSTEHAYGAIALWCAGLPAQAEVLCRAVFEHSVGLLFLIRDDTDASTAAYFQDFIKREKKFIDGARSTLDAAILRQRETALRHREACVTDLTSQFGHAPSAVMPWPNIFERCRSVGLEEEYRLFYPQLSSQPHGDAEDLINELMVAAAGDDVRERLAVETVEFSWTLTLASLDVYLCSLAQFSQEMLMGSAAKPAEEMRKTLASIDLIPGKVPGGRPGR